MTYPSRALLTVAAVAALYLLTLPSTASAAPVACGAVITEDLTLDHDLTDCPDDGLVVAADRITIDLNGHEISSPCDPFVNCAGTVGIDNSGGYDRVRIRNGTVVGFEQNILLVGARWNTLARLSSRGGKFNHDGSTSLELQDSHRNVVKDSSIRGGDPAILLTASDRNRIVRTSIRGGISIRVGEAIYLLEGSDANTVVDSDIDGGGAGGMIIGESVRNRVKRNTGYGYAGAMLLRNADRTVVKENTLNGGQGCALCVRGDQNTIRGNQGDTNGGIEIEGDRNLVVGNRADGDFFAPTAITLHGGDRNVIRGNEASDSFEAPVIHVLQAATRTSLVRNSASDGTDISEPGVGDGIRVDAPGTWIRGNTANDNDALGINAVDGVIDGGDNHASGNGDPRQCVGVVCAP